MARVRQELVVATAALEAGDPAFAPVIAAAGPPRLRARRSPGTHFGELARAICYQQLAGAAARTIHGRFVALFDDGPTPEAVLAAPLEDLRGAGLSGAKAASIHDLAMRVAEGELALDRLGRLGDDEVVEQLSAVRGIGRWTAEMFLIGQLGRLDVWPVDDLGVRKGYGVIHGIAPAPTARDLQAMGDGLRPYRSVAAWYCWRVLDAPG